jgi:transcriptional repressor NrdR
VYCPFCDHPDTKVIDARNHRDAPVKWRRRECSECGRRFTTYERVEELMPEVVKHDGRREPYQRAKLMAGLQRACEKRPVPMSSLEDLVSRVERALVELGEREVASEKIGNQVRDELRKLDPIAWLRFSSVYLDFGTIEEFRTALDEYEAKRGRD